MVEDGLKPVEAFGFGRITLLNLSYILLCTFEDNLGPFRQSIRDVLTFYKGRCSEKLESVLHIVSSVLRYTHFPHYPVGPPLLIYLAFKASLF